MYIQGGKNIKVGIIGMPIDFSSYGHGEGCNKGPENIRINGLIKGLEKFEIEYQDFGDVQIPPKGKVANKRLKYLEEIVEATDNLIKKTRQCKEEGFFPLILGGDHSAAIGSIKAIKDLETDKTGLLWIDSHPDCNTKSTTTSGNIHGMVIPQLAKGGHPGLMELGKEVNFNEIAMLGIKNADQSELKFIKDNNIYLQDIWEIEKKGIEKVANSAINYLLENNKKIYVSLDLDVIDIEYAPGVGTPTHGGITYREILYVSRLLNKLFRSRILAGVDIVELNPSRDKNKKTVSLAVEIIMSILGYEYGPFAIFRDNRGPI